MSNIVTLNNDNFKDEISAGVSLVDFWASWCGPCRMIGPVVDELSGELEGKAKVAKLNVDDAGAIAAEYGVMTIPTLIVFKDGEEKERVVGVKPKQELAAMVEKFL